VVGSAPAHLNEKTFGQSGQSDFGVDVPFSGGYFGRQNNRPSLGKVTERWERLLRVGGKITLGDVRVKDATVKQQLRNQGVTADSISEHLAAAVTFE